ncbi:putative glycoside hydrolase family 16 protein [Neofusicoccum parvum UCRNP2]|uniref:Putative glycoside hydrolase family 16 protein n=1 Tax=Botryosphaeria parva (strain UCR-NP2) TaxID=1287680 RepID=R1EWM2_BOTPV|nr:putative glycoside hydrolase family 16 protein [Neofusicoccum parvum UCRNP2]
MALSSKLCRLAAAAVGLLFLAGPALAADQDCSCGFYDDTTGDLFTESLIQYFNETADLDQFILENFEHKSEKSWNSKFRQGALPDNVVDNSTSLELYCDPYDDAHVVNGGSIRSVRRDIQYGSFRSLMRGPRQGMGGSSLTMRLLFNETESLEINVMNTDSNATAWVSTLMQNEWPDRDLGINYTILGNSSLANGTAWPWDFMEFRIDWTDKEVRYYVGQNNSRTVTKKKHGQIPMTPSPLYFRHWSIGNTYSMEGPPYFRSVANVGWMRMFFNTSTMTDDQHEVFDARCTIEDACSMNDMDLRLVSSEKGFGAARIKEVVEEPKEHPLKTATNAADTKAADKIPTAKKARVDYLAGLVALCSIFVTLIHFHLTYVPAVVIPGAFVHYPSELWAERLISPFIMNQMWLGVFFTTSTRFLSARYFREGKLDVIAERAVKRAPRLMIPVTAMVLFEYFFIDVGATKYLEYLPSVTWSTWGYVAKFPSVGHFISEILELVYLIPNAVPQITFNYCTGVLWTIAVQLQGSWVVLLGAILIREIKTPWKRFGYYAFCVVNNWYARNWGSFFWLGLMLTDLDITYKWRKYLYPRPLVYYPLICFCSFMTLVGFTMNLLPQWISFNFTTHENGIHPDQETGLPIMETDNYGYPNYYEPRFNMLLFAVGMQAIVELSAVVQKILSFPLLVWVFPHIFTIYLIHGFIFWSWGAWLCVFLASRDFVYWLNILLTGVTCYAIIILSLPIVTPAIEILGRDITINIWEFANQKPPPKKDTLFPFNKDELGMQGEKSEEQTTGKEEEYSEKHQTKFDEKNVV